MAVQYVKNPKDVDNPYVSPVMAKDLSNLPPAVIILAENDDLRQDGEKYAERLIAAGVHTNIYVQWGIGHLAGNGARASNLAQESLDVAVAALRGAFLERRQSINSRLRSLIQLKKKMFFWKVVPAITRRGERSRASTILKPT